MTILALDLSSKTGFAIWRPGMEFPQSGVVDMRRNTRGDLFVIFRDWLLEMLIGAKVTHIVREAPFVSKDAMSAVPLLYGLAAHVEEAGARRKIPVREVAPHEWRKFMIGQSMAPRAVAKNHRTAWLKKQVLDACIAQGLKPKDDNEADAIGLLFFERARLYPQFAAHGDLGL